VKEYSLSFTAGNLLFPETMEVINIHLATLDWAVTQERVFAENTLQYKSPKSSRRIFPEIKYRISQLSLEELNYFLNSDKETQIGILWIAICLQYRLIYEFVSETIPQKIILLEENLTYPDYENFFEMKATDSSWLTKTAESTRYKAKSIVFKMLTQVGIIENKKIIPMILPPKLGEFIIQKDVELLKLFPLTNSELGRWLND